MNCISSPIDPPAEEPGPSPDVASWAIPTGFSPAAPWSLDDLATAKSSGASATLIRSSSAALFAEFHARLVQSGLLPGCLPTMAEFAHLLALRQVRTPNDEEKISDEVHGHNLVYWLQRVARKPSFKLTLLLELVIDEATRPILYAKLQYNRVRPYQWVPELAPRFLPPTMFPMHPSFPSGHSTQAHLAVKVMEAVYGKAGLPGDLCGAAWRVARNRELAGLHYPSDTDSGPVLAQVLIEDATRVPLFEQYAEEIRAE